MSARLAECTGGSRVLAALSTLVAVVCSMSTDIDTKGEYCEAETFSAQCPPGAVVVMRHAQYGRMSMGRCVILNYGYVGCKAEVLPHLDAICSGRPSCEVRIPDASLDSANPCPKDLKTYLQASYECVTARFSQCTTDCHNFTLIRADSGYLTTYVTKEDESTCATRSRCPWRLRVASGQRINVTLMDFNIGKTARRTTNTLGKYRKTNCRRYAVITEPGSKKTHEVCGATVRKTHVYESSGNIVDIQPLEGAAVRRRLFLLQYEAIGCADFPRPPNARMKRHGYQLLISCLATRRSYQLMCRERKWIGTVGVCPPYTPVANTEELKADGIGVPIGLMVAIVAAIALVTGTCIVMAGLVILKRRRLARARTHVTVVDTSYSATCQQRSTLHEQQYSGSSAKSTPNEYDYSMEMRPLPSVPASEKDLSKRQSGTAAADDMLPQQRVVAGKFVPLPRDEYDPRSSTVVTYFELDVEKVPPGRARRYEKMRERRDGDTDAAPPVAEV